MSPVIGLVAKETIGIEQLSVAVGAVHVATAVVPDVVRLIFVGHAVKTGLIISVAHGSQLVQFKRTFPL